MLSSGATNDLVFTRCDGRPWRSFRPAFRKACRRARLGPEVTPHTLRHTFASKLAMANGDARTSQDLGGWSSLSMVERCSHLSTSHRDEAFTRIEAARVAAPSSVDAKFLITGESALAVASVNG